MTNVIILAAGEVLKKINFLKSVNKSPALIPINTRPVILYLLEFYSQFNDINVHIAINELDASSISEELNTLDYKFQTHKISNTSSVNDTLSNVISSINDSENTIVNVVTSIPVSLPQQNTVFLDESSTTNKYWSVLCFEDNAVQFYSKQDSNTHIGHAFTGIFNCNTDALKKAVEVSVTNSDLLTVIKDVNRKVKINFEKKLWIDCGHELNYYDAKLKLISSRSFNRISINSDGVLKKGSTNYKKLRDEFNFIKSLPPELSLLFPRLLEDYSLDGNKNIGSYSMEFYGYPSLSELQLFWDLDFEIWNRIFDNVKRVVLSFKNYEYSIGYNAYKVFFVDKLSERIELFKQQCDEDFLNLINNGLVINGMVCKPYDQLSDKLVTALLNLYSENDFCIAHGDLCFNNMLYDINHKILKLIDPRGSFGEKCIGIYGDVKYDLAKFLHSSVGHYDYIVNNLYSLSVEGNNVTYNVHLRSNQEIIEQKSKKLISDLDFKYNDIMLIVGTLFLSMPPLHNDSKSRQKMMYLHGLLLINKYL